MAKLSIKAGATSVSINIWIASSSSTTGAGLTGLAYNTASLTAYYTFAGSGTTSTAITLVTLASVTAAWVTGGFIQIDSTNMPGWYRFDIPNAVIASGNGRSVAIHFQGATNMAPLPIEIELTGWDNQDAVHGGLSAIPNVASGTTGCLVVSGSGTGGLTLAGGVGSANVTQALGNAVTTTTNGILDINVKNYNNVTATTDANNYPKVDIVDLAGTAVLATAGLISANTTQFGGTAITQTAGIPSVNTTQFNGTTSVGTAGYVGLDWGHITAPTTVVGLTNTTISTGQTIGAVTGAVGSVTGAVGSVTGNVGGSVNSVVTTVTANTTQFGGTAITQTAGIPSVNTSQFLGHAVVLDVNNFPKVDVQDILGSASVGAAGYVGVDWSQIANSTATEYLTGTTIASVLNAVPSNITQILGTAVTATSGVMGVNTTQFNGQSVVLDANNLPKVDVQDILGTVSQGAAGYVGVDWSKITNSTATENLSGTTVSNVTSAVSSNVTQFGGTAITQTAGIPSVNTSQFLGHAVVLDTNNFPKVDLEDWNGQSAAAMVSSQQFTAYALANGPGGSSSGSGMYAVTFTVQDSTSMALLAGVTVSAILANTEVAYATTNSSGVAVLNLNAGTYEFLARSNSGAYFTYASTGNVVTGIEAVSIPLVAYPPIIPATPPQCVISFYLLTSAGLPRNKVRVSFSATAPSASPVGNSYTSTDFVFSTNTGLVSYTGLCGTGYTIEVQGGSSVNITTPTNVGAYVVPNPPG